jgi:hypothetical protein
MREQIIADLSTHFSPRGVVDLVEAYEQLVRKQRTGDLEGALTKAGRFVEHLLRLLEQRRTGVLPPEIKSVSAAIRALENDTDLPEPLRLLIPRVAYGMIYNLRSKRDAVHVKEIDPRQIDGALAVSSASWIIAELLRMYHNSDEGAVSRCMAALTRGSIPFVEAIEGEVFVAQAVPARIEMLLLLAHASPQGLSRRAIGNSAKCSQPSVSKALSALLLDRKTHQAQSELYFLTSAGERELADWLSEVL